MSKYNCFLIAILLAFVCHNVDSQVTQTMSRACEGTDMYLGCSSGSLLNVYWANYGRLLPGCLACPKPFQDLNIFCTSYNVSLTTMRSRCNGMENCTVSASNSVFGEPCPGVYKYLAASYLCIPYKRVCEGSTMNITCPSGQVINIVSANFGRTMNGTEVCQYSDPSATTNTNCYAANSTLIISNACNNKNTCSVPATNTYFGGDPCYGTYKYLQVSYYCY